MRRAIAYGTILLLFAFSVGVLPRPASAVIVSTSGFHLVATPGQQAFGVNLDGVVRLQVDGQTGCNAALITDRHLLSAAHCFDSDSDGRADPSPETFTAVFDLPSGVVPREFSSNDVSLRRDWPETYADISVIKLPADAPAEVPRYPIYGIDDEIGKTTLIVGHGSTGTGSGGQTIFLDEKLAGLNRYDAPGENVPRQLPLPPNATLAYDFDSGFEENNTLAAWGFVSDLGFGDDEVKAAKGDSGAPVFINGAIAGVISLGDGGLDTTVLGDN